MAYEIILYVIVHVSIICHRMAYQVILGADWESDGTVGLYSIPVATDVTELEGEFPCPIGQHVS